MNKKSECGGTFMKRVAVVACLAMLLAVFLIPGGARAFDKACYNAIINEARMGMEPDNGQLASCDLTGADFTASGVAGKNINGWRFNGAHLNGAHFEGQSMNGTTFKGAKLNGAHFEGASMRDVDFTGPGTELAGAHFDGAHLNNAKLMGANIGENTNIYAADTAGADFSGAFSDSFTCAPKSIGKCIEVKK
jgi:uncharacterized protein YjbI with pentapeptide repeats